MFQAIKSNPGTVFILSFASVVFWGVAQLLAVLPTMGA